MPTRRDLWHFRNGKAFGPFSGCLTRGDLLLEAAVSFLLAPGGMERPLNLKFNKRWSKVENNCLWEKKKGRGRKRCSMIFLYGNQTNFWCTFTLLNGVRVLSSHIHTSIYLKIKKKILNSFSFFFMKLTDGIFNGFGLRTVIHWGREFACFVQTEILFSIFFFHSIRRRKIFFAKLSIITPTQWANGSNRGLTSWRSHSLFIQRLMWFEFCYDFFFLWIAKMRRHWSTS